MLQVNPNPLVKDSQPSANELGKLGRGRAKSGHVYVIVLERPVLSGARSHSWLRPCERFERERNL